MTEMDEILARLDPKTRKRLQLARDVKIDKQLTPSVGLNLALKGGLAYGRQHLIWGNKSAGKSTFCMQLIAAAQAEGKVCAWVDVEGTYDPAWAARMGVDNSNLVIVPEVAINKVTDACVQLIQAGIDIIVIDSISATLSGAYYDDDEIKEFDKTGQIGSQAKDLSKMSNMLLGVNEKTMIIMISQQTNEISATYTKLGFNGGNRVKHNSTTIIKLFSTESDSKAKKEKIRVNDNLIEKVVGRPVVWEVEFNKTAAMGPRGTYDFYFDGTKPVGVNRQSELVELGILYGLIKKSGAWYSLNDKMAQGKDAMTDYLIENPDVAASTEEAIYGLFTDNPDAITAREIEGEADQ